MDWEKFIDEEYTKKSQKISNNGGSQRNFKILKSSRDVRNRVQTDFSTKSIENNVKATKQFNLEEEMIILKKQNKRLQDENNVLKQENFEQAEKLKQNEKVFQKFSSIKELIKQQKNYISELQQAVQEKDKYIEQLVFLNATQKQLQLKNNLFSQNSQQENSNQQSQNKTQENSKQLLQLLQKGQLQKQNLDKNLTFKNF